MSRCIDCVQFPTGDGYSGETTVRSPNRSVIDRHMPSLNGKFGSMSDTSANVTDAFTTEMTMFAGPRVCGSVPLKSKSISLPFFVTVTNRRTGSPVPLPSSSSHASPENVPSFHPLRYSLNSFSVPSSVVLKASSTAPFPKRSSSSTIRFAAALVMPIWLFMSPSTRCGLRTLVWMSRVNSSNTLPRRAYLMMGSRKPSWMSSVARL